MSDETNNLEPEAPGEVDLPAPSGLASKPRKPTEIVPSDRLGFEKHFETIKAFAIAVESNGGPVDVKQAAQVMGMSEHSIAVVLAFFTDVGAIIRVAGGGKYDVSDAAKEYVQAIEWGDEHAAHKLRPHFVDRWFSKALLPRLRARPYSMDEACKILAEAAGGASKHYRPNFERLVAALDIVGLCKVEGNQVSSIATGGVEKADERREPDKPKIEVPVIPPEKIIPDDAPFLFLDRKRERKITLIAPDSLTSSEVAKIKSWLELVLFVEDDA